MTSGIQIIHKGSYLSIGGTAITNTTSCTIGGTATTTTSCTIGGTATTTPPPLVVPSVVLPPPPPVVLTILWMTWNHTFFLTLLLPRLLTGYSSFVMNSNLPSHSTNPACRYCWCGGEATEQMMQDLILNLKVFGTAGIKTRTLMSGCSIYWQHHIVTNHYLLSTVNKNKKRNVHMKIAWFRSNTDVFPPCFYYCWWPESHY